VGAVQELELGRSILRIGSFLEPVTANGPKAERPLSANRAMCGVAIQYIEGHVRVLSFLNQAGMGTFGTPHQDIIATRKAGTISTASRERRTKDHAQASASSAVLDGMTVRPNRGPTPRSTALQRGSQFVETDGADPLMYWGPRWPSMRSQESSGYWHEAATDSSSETTAGHAGGETILETYYGWRVQKFVTISPDYQFIATGIHRGYGSGERILDQIPR